MLLLRRKLGKPRPKVGPHRHGIVPTQKYAITKPADVEFNPTLRYLHVAGFTGVVWLVEVALLRCAKDGDDARFVKYNQLPDTAAIAGETQPCVPLEVGSELVCV